MTGSVETRTPMLLGPSRLAALIGICAFIIAAGAPLSAQRRADSSAHPVSTRADTDTTTIEGGAARSALTFDTLAFISQASMTLREAIDSALALSPVTSRAEANAKLARAAERVASGEYLPYLAVTSSVSRSGLPSLPGAALENVIGSTTVGAGGAGGGVGGSADSIGIPVQSSSATRVRPLAVIPATPTAAVPAAVNPTYVPAATLVAGWDVFTAGRRQADNQRASAEARAAASISTRQRYVVIDSVKMVFFEVLRGEGLDAVAREEVIRTEEDAREAAARHDIGTATTSEVLQFQLDVNNARVSLIEAEIDRRTGAFGLGRLTGIDGAVEASADSSFPIRPLALPDSEIVALALNAAPVLLASRDSAAAAAAALVAERAQYAPTLTLGTSYTWTRDVTTSVEKPGWAVDLMTSYPVFNGFVREYDVERASEASTVARVTARDQTRQTRAEAERLLGSILLADRLVSLAIESVATAREAYRVDYARYRLGLVTALELRTTEQSYTQAEQQLVTARYNALLARASLEALVGREL